MTLRSDSILLTLGRLPKAMDIARALDRAGCRVFIAEPLGLYLARVSNCLAGTVRVRAPRDHPEGYLDDLVAAVSRTQAGLVVPVSEEIPHVAGLHGRLPEGVRLFSMTREDILAVHDKLRFTEVARSAGVRVPATALANSAEAALIRSDTDAVLKPRLSCAGRGVHWLPAGTQDLPEGLPDEELLVQERIRGEECSSFSIAHEGRVLGTVVYRSVLRSGTVAVCFERVTHLPQINAWVERFVDALGWSGFISFDFMVDARGMAWGIECNPRANSGIHFVMPDSLAQAILSPVSTPSLRFHREGWRQQFYSCLTLAQSRMWRKGFLQYARVLAKATDVTWDWRDPLPFCLMTLTASNLLWASWRSGRPIGEIATEDISWRADSAAA